MAEVLNLTVPIVPSSISSYKVVFLQLDWGEKSILVKLRGTNGEQFSYSYNGDEANDLMVALNTVNLSTISLQRRIMQRLIADGVLVGSVSGSPD